jgi:hypothetical protein
MHADNNLNAVVRTWHPLEYAHVFLWLVKDLCWAQGWKTAGSMMVIPAVLVAVVITWLQRKHRFTLVHNLAICTWITSNSLWMLAEFFKMESSLKPVSIIGFLLGILILMMGYAGYLLGGKKSKQPQ